MWREGGGENKKAAPFMPTSKLKVYILSLPHLVNFKYKDTGPKNIIAYSSCKPVGLSSVASPHEKKLDS